LRGPLFVIGVRTYHFPLRNEMACHNGKLLLCSLDVHCWCYLESFTYKNSSCFPYVVGIRNALILSFSLPSGRLLSTKQGAR